MATSLAGVVLCGGASRRMGRDKALLPVAGEPLVVRVARRLGQVADPVLLATGTPGRLGDLGYEEVADAVADAGPLAGLVAGLAAGGAPHTAVVAVDLPYVHPQVLRLLARSCAGYDAAIPVTDDGPQPLHAVYAASALPGLRNALADGRYGVRTACDQLRWRAIEPTEWRRLDPDGRFALNLNRPDDLARLGLT